VNNTRRSNGNSELDFEEKLWAAADKLRSNMDASEYKHVVLGLVFLKYVSDAFSDVYEELKKDPTSDPEDVDEYIARRVFWVPKDARWSYLAKNAKKPEIGKLIDEAMDVIERENRSLRGVLLKNYARPALNKQRLGELIDLIGTIGLGDRENRSKDILGRVYEYFLGQFAAAEGKKGGQFYTPRSIVRLLVEMLEPYKGRILDPCCGSGGMFVQSEKFIEAHGGKIGDVSVFGQESNQTTWRLCKMNLALRGIDANIEWGDSFREDQFKDLRADFILANPPFNDSDWGVELFLDDVRWKFGVPPKGNANFGWVQHFIHHLSPTGLAGFVLANGSMSGDTKSVEGRIRKAIIEADLVDCMISLPGQLFYSTPIPACLWFIARDKENRKFRDRRGETLFIDARRTGFLVDRIHRELSREEIDRISKVYHAWRGGKNAEKYEDIPGFCRRTTLKEIESNGYVLTPGRYVGTEDIKDDNDLSDQEIKLLIKELGTQFSESACLEQIIRQNMSGLGYAI
jgi:type I restriction enzyme M protein